MQPQLEKKKKNNIGNYRRDNHQDRIYEHRHQWTLLLQHVAEYFEIHDTFYQASLFFTTQACKTYRDFVHILQQHIKQINNMYEKIINLNAGRTNNILYL